jgi:hypothetical protein
LNIHIAQSRLRQVRAFVIKVVGLFFGDWFFALHIAHVQSPLDIMTDAWARQRQEVDHPGATLKQRSRIRIAESVGQQPLTLRIKPKAALERF